jgi:GH25 family lysozyme M1 (1,4-beta-N-acetylmuramidase)
VAEQIADLSHHQGTFDVAAYKAAGHRTVILKATEGTGYVDPTFTARWRAAGNAGLRRIAYHYTRAANNGATEFDWFLTAVTNAGGLRDGDLLCQDVEDTDTPARAAANSREFGARAAARGYPTGWVYTGRWYANPNGITAGLYPPGWRQLWLSHYDASVTDDQILMPTGWARSQCVARQFTDRANVAGIGSCDYSRLLIPWDTTTGGLHMDADVTAAFAAVPGQTATAVKAALQGFMTEVDNRITHVEQMVPAAAAQSAARDAAALAATGDAKAAVVALAKALPTSGMSDEQVTALAQTLAAGIGGLETQAVVDALRLDVVTRLSDPKPNPDPNPGGTQ